MAYEIAPSGLTLPTGPPTPAEVWQETVDLLEQNPAAYRFTDHYTEPLSTTRGYRTLWQFHNYDPDRDDWSHVAVHGHVPEFNLSQETRAAVRHIHNIHELTRKEKKAGILGVQATQFCGIVVHFPEEELVDAVRAIMPQQVRQLTVQTRQGVKGQDPEALHDVPPTNLVVRLDHPSQKTGFLAGDTSSDGYSALAQANGIMESLVPNFNPGAVRFHTFR